VKNELDDKTAPFWFSVLEDDVLFACLLVSNLVFFLFLSSFFFLYIKEDVLEEM
jgi:hypothetical protein